MEILRQSSEPTLDLGMAVRAEQSALAHLGTASGQGTRMPVVTETELLATGVEVVELQRPNPPTIPAEDAGSPNLRNQPLLDGTAAFRHCRRPTFLTSIVTSSLENELGGSMPPALEDCRLAATG